MKVWFDDNVSVIIDAALMSGMFDPTSAILKFTDNEFIEKISNYLLTFIERNQNKDENYKEFV